MKLAVDVRDRTGRLLASQGTLLTAQHLTVFRTWGIKTVDILDAGEEDGADGGAQRSVSEEDLAAMARKMEVFFRLVDLEHPFFKELLRLAAYRQAVNDD